MFFSIAGKTMNDKCTGACEPVDRSKLVNDSGKNRQTILCRRCGSVIFTGKVVVLVDNVEKEIKNMSVGAASGAGKEKIRLWWYTESDLVFDTIGWQTVDGVRALVCGDCEFGPFGWRSDDNKKFYVSAERVKYL